MQSARTPNGEYGEILSVETSRGTTSAYVKTASSEGWYKLSSLQIEAQICSQCGIGTILPYNPSPSVVNTNPFSTQQGNEGHQISLTPTCDHCGTQFPLQATSPVPHSQVDADRGYAVENLPSQMEFAEPNRNFPVTGSMRHTALHKIADDREDWAPTTQQEQQSEDGYGDSANPEAQEQAGNLFVFVLPDQPEFDQQTGLRDPSELQDVNLDAPFDPDADSGNEADWDDDDSDRWSQDFAPTAAVSNRMKSTYENEGAKAWIKNPEWAKIKGVRSKIRSLDSIEVKKGMEGNGHSSRLLKSITDDADRTGTHLLLETYPYSHSGVSNPLGNDILREWYGKNGFKPDSGGGEDSMIRHPTGCSCPPERGSVQEEDQGYEDSGEYAPHGLQPDERILAGSELDKHLQKFHGRSWAGGNKDGHERLHSPALNKGYAEDGRYDLIPNHTHSTEDFRQLLASAPGTVRTVHAKCPHCSSTDPDANSGNEADWDDDDNDRWSQDFAPTAAIKSSELPVDRVQRGYLRNHLVYKHGMDPGYLKGHTWSDDEIHNHEHTANYEFQNHEHPGERFRNRDNTTFEPTEESNSDESRWSYQPGAGEGYLAGAPGTTRTVHAKCPHCASTDLEVRGEGKLARLACRDCGKFIQTTKESATKESSAIYESSFLDWSDAVDGKTELERISSRLKISETELDMANGNYGVGAEDSYSNDTGTTRTDVESPPWNNVQSPASQPFLPSMASWKDGTSIRTADDTPAPAGGQGATPLQSAEQQVGGVAQTIDPTQVDTAGQGRDPMSQQQQSGGQGSMNIGDMANNPGAPTNLPMNTPLLPTASLDFLGFNTKSDFPVDDNGDPVDDSIGPLGEHAKAFNYVAGPEDIWKPPPVTREDMIAENEEAKKRQHKIDQDLWARKVQRSEGQPQEKPSSSRPQERYIAPNALKEFETTAKETALPQQEAICPDCGKVVHSSKTRKRGQDVTCPQCGKSFDPEVKKKLLSAFAEYENLLEKDAIIREAAWAQVRAKAVRLRKEGRISVVSYKKELIEAEVRGDHGTYKTEVHRYAGFGFRPTQVAKWKCSCKWGQIRQIRQPKSPYLNRMCSHAFGTYMEQQALDHKKKNVPQALKMKPSNIQSLTNFQELTTDFPLLQTQFEREGWHNATSLETAEGLEVTAVAHDLGGYSLREHMKEHHSGGDAIDGYSNEVLGVLHDAIHKPEEEHNVGPREDEHSWTWQPGAGEGYIASVEALWNEAHSREAAVRKGRDDLKQDDGGNDICPECGSVNLSQDSGYNNVGEYATSCKNCDWEGIGNIYSGKDHKASLDTEALWNKAFDDPTGNGYAGDNLLSGGPEGQGPTPTSGDSYPLTYDISQRNDQPTDTYQCPNCGIGGSVGDISEPGSSVSTCPTCNFRGPMSSFMHDQTQSDATATTASVEGSITKTEELMERPYGDEELANHLIHDHGYTYQQLRGASTQDLDDEHEYDHSGYPDKDFNGHQHVGSVKEAAFECPICGTLHPGNPGSLKFKMCDDCHNSTVVAPEDCSSCVNNDHGNCTGRGCECHDENINNAHGGERTFNTPFVNHVQFSQSSVRLSSSGEDWERSFKPCSDGCPMHIHYDPDDEDGEKTFGMVADHSSHGKGYIGYAGKIVNGDISERDSKEFTSTSLEDAKNGVEQVRRKYLLGSEVKDGEQPSEVPDSYYKVPLLHTVDQPKNFNPQKDNRVERTFNTPFVNHVQFSQSSVKESGNPMGGLESGTSQTTFTPAAAPAPVEGTSSPEEVKKIDNPERSTLPTKPLRGTIPHMVPQSKLPSTDSAFNSFLGFNITTGTETEFAGQSIPDGSMINPDTEDGMGGTGKGGGPLATPRNSKNTDTTPLTEASFSGASYRVPQKRNDGRKSLEELDEEYEQSQHQVEATATEETPTTTQSSILAEFQRDASHILEPNSSSGSGGFNIAEAAESFLAGNTRATPGGTNSRGGIQTISGRQFSPREQASLMAETPSSGRGASNLNALNLEGTHYAQPKGRHLDVLDDSDNILTFF